MEGTKKESADTKLDSSEDSSVDLSKGEEKSQPGASSETYSAAEAVRFIQGGLLCRGIYLADQLEELEKDREPVMDVRDDLRFRGAKSVQENVHKEFTSEQTTEIFEQTIDKNKMSGSGSAGLVVWGMGLSTVSSHSRKSQKEKTVEETMKKGQKYASSLDCQFVPVKSIHLTYSDISLRSDAIDELKKVEDRIKTMRYQSNGQFRNFF